MKKQLDETSSKRKALKRWQEHRIAALARRPTTAVSPNRKKCGRGVLAVTTARLAALDASTAAQNAEKAARRCAAAKNRTVVVKGLSPTACDFSPVCTQETTSFDTLESSSDDEAPKVSEETPGRLFEHFVVAGLPTKMVQHEGFQVNARYTPKILYHRPCPPCRDLDLDAADAVIADFCLPAGAAVKEANGVPGTLADRPIVESVFVLSGGENSGVRYGVCAQVGRYYERHSDDVVEADCCYCLITRYPYLRLHFAVLRAVIEHERTKQGQHRRYAAVDAVIRKYGRLSPPMPGDLVVLPPLYSAGEDGGVQWRRPINTEAGSSSEDRKLKDEATALVREWALPHVFRKLSLANFLFMLGCALVEMQIVFVSRDLRTLTSSALGLVAMLRPLRWAGPLITALPSKLSEYLDSPVPLILGVASLPVDFVQGAEMVLVFVDEDRVRLPPKLLAEPGAHLSIQLPKLTQLCHDLQDTYDSDDDSALHHVAEQVHEHLKTLVVTATELRNERLRQRASHRWLSRDREGGDGTSSQSGDSHSSSSDNIRNYCEGTSRPASVESLAAAVAATTADAVEAKRRPSFFSVVRSGSFGDATTPQKKSMSPSACRQHVWWYDFLGDAGPSFVGRFVNTQLFSNYAQHKDLELTAQDVDASRKLRRDAKKLSESLFAIMIKGGDSEQRTVSPTNSLEDSPRRQKDDDDGPCNGRCGGRLDTARCTLLCAQLWEAKERSKRRLPEVPLVVSSPTSKCEVLRHPAETKGQYARRRRFLETTTPVPTVSSPVGLSFEMRPDSRGRPSWNDKGVAPVVASPKMELTSPRPRRRKRNAEIAVRRMRRDARVRKRESPRSAAIAIQRSWRSRKDLILLQSLARRRIAEALVLRRFYEEEEDPGRRRATERLRSLLEAAAMSAHDKYIPTTWRLSVGDQLRFLLTNTFQGGDHGRRRSSLCSHHGVVLNHDEVDWGSSPTAATKAPTGSFTDDEATYLLDVVPPRPTQESAMDTDEDGVSDSSEPQLPPMVPTKPTERLPAQESLSYDDVEFRSALRAGIVCVKHGRYGKPHRRLVQCTCDFSGISWSRFECTAPIDIFDSSRSGSSATTTRRRRKSLVQRCLAVAKRILTSNKKRTLDFSDVALVTSEPTTSNAKRAFARDHLGNSFLVSLVFNDSGRRRSLDLEFATARQHRSALHAFQKLVNPVTL